MVDYNQITVIGEESNKKVALTSNEQTIKNTDEKNWTDESADRKLAQIKSLRLEKLIETDYLALSDVTLSDSVKTWRQSLRDIPANHVDEAAYDLLLARDPDTKELTHSVWSKP
jgi:hypothetical protein